METGFSFKLSRFFLSLAVFLIPFYFFRFSFDPLKTNVFEVTVFVATLFSILYSLFSRTKFRFGSMWPYLFLLISFVSIFIASDKTAALGIFKGWFLVPILLYWLVINIFVKKDLYRLTLVLFASLIIVGLWGLLQDFGTISTLFYQKDDPSFSQYLAPSNFRIFGPFESPNFLAMFLVPVIFLCLPLLMHFRRMPVSRTLSLLFVFGITIYILLMTGSRAGIIAFILPFIFVCHPGLWLESRDLKIPGLKPTARNDSARPGKNWLMVVFLVAVVLMFLMILARTSTDRSESNISRLKIYHYALEIGKANPLLGIGLGSFQTKITEAAKDDTNFIQNTLPYALHPHNVYLATWLNLGILGLIIFVILVMNFFRRLWPRRNYYLALCLMAAMAAILIHGLFDTTYFKNDLSAIFWLILAMAELTSSKKHVES